LAMLPKDAGQNAVRRALEASLRNTRKGPKGVLPAHRIWNSFLDEMGNNLDGFETFHELKTIVSQALSLEDSLRNEATAIDRNHVEAQLSAVSQAIQAVIEEVNSG